MQKEEWEEIYRKYYRPVYAYALFLTGSWQDAQDLVQETFVRAFLAWEATGSVKAWLLTVLRNLYFNQQRQRKREVTDDGALIAGMHAEEKDGLTVMMENEERRQLFREIRRLPALMRNVLMESIWFEMNDAEIAALHGLTKENVRQIRRRAKQKLMERMKEEEV